MSNNISSLFENLMVYNESHSKRNIKRKIEADQTLLNLSVELPDNIIDDIEPEDVKVDVGVMNVDTDDVDEINVDTDENDIDDEDTDIDSEDNIDDEKDTDTKESFSFKNEKGLKLKPKCDECDKKEESSLDNAKANIRRRVKTNEALLKEDWSKGIILSATFSIDEAEKAHDAGTFFIGDGDSIKNYIGVSGYSVYNKDNYRNKMPGYVEVYENEVIYTLPIYDNEIKQYLSGGISTLNKAIKTKNISVINNVINEFKDILKSLGINSYKIDVTLSSNGDEFTQSLNEVVKTRKEKKTCKESLMHLDTKSLNKLITDFVRENYKNIDKVVITKAILENKQLTLRGYIQDRKGLKESIVLSNRGFDPKKLENTRFLIDFKDMNRTFGVIKESLKQPFTFTATMKNGIVKFESLKCNFKTRINESTLARITGNYLYE